MCSLIALWISTFLQNFITLCCLVFELCDLEKKKKKKKKNKTIIAPYIYDARNHANHYILSTIVLGDPTSYSFLKVGWHIKLQY